MGEMGEMEVQADQEGYNYTFSFRYPRIRATSCAADPAQFIGSGSTYRHREHKRNIYILSAYTCFAWFASESKLEALSLLDVWGGASATQIVTSGN